MILPTKHLSLEKSALGSAAVLLRAISGKPTVSELWENVAGTEISTFDQFVRALDLLFILGAVEHQGGRLELT